MDRGPQGYSIPTTTGDETYRSFVPHALPPDPALRLDGDLYDLIERANRGLGRLDGISLILPDISLFLYFYVRKEAVLSAQIEGTQSSLSDLLIYESTELPGVPLDDVLEVSNYVAAMAHGIDALREGNPLTVRLIKDVHRVLLSRGRGAERNPGEFRTSQNWVVGTRPGNAIYVPPPFAEVDRLMGELANFIHDIPARTPTLIKAALAHVQFETIHPFLDGNGRVGRLLVPMILFQEGAVRNPLLYLSLYFKTHRDEYYRLLQKVRLHGDWEAWLRFFMAGVEVTANQAVETARSIRSCFEADRERITLLGRQAGSALRLHDFMHTHPLFTIAQATRSLGLSKPTVGTCVRNLQEIGILRTLNARGRGQLYAYDAYLRILNEGTESPV
jgi:Fic family protein